MRIVIINKFGQHVIRDASFVPRIGDQIDAFYEPFPTVTHVLAFPQLGTIKKLNGDGPIDAIITVE